MMERSDLIRQWKRMDGRKIECSHFLGITRLGKKFNETCPIVFEYQVLGRLLSSDPSLKHFKTNFEI